MSFHYPEHFCWPPCPNAGRESLSRSYKSRTRMHVQDWNSAGTDEKVWLWTTANCRYWRILLYFDNALAAETANVVRALAIQKLDWWNEISARAVREINDYYNHWLDAKHPWRKWQTGTSQSARTENNHELENTNWSERIHRLQLYPFFKMVCMS